MDNVKEKVGFKSDPTGFVMTFENEWTISIQWQGSQAEIAECAVWYAAGDWFNLLEYDEFAGGMSPGEVSEVMERVRKFPK